jgi:hypothetical protein
MTNKQINAYKRTSYKVFEPSLCIKIGEQNEALRDLLEQYKATEYAYITAYNPFSKKLDEAENHNRHLRLTEDIKQYTFFEGEGCGEDSSWPCERSYLVLGISREQAIDLGFQYKQNAIVYGQIDGLPELLVLEKENKLPSFGAERDARFQSTIESLAKLSDHQLIDSFNREVGNGGWGTARADYIHCLRCEIKRRAFDSSLIFHTTTFEDGSVSQGLSFKRKVKLRNGKLVYMSPGEDQKQVHKKDNFLQKLWIQCKNLFQ